MAEKSLVNEVAESVGTAAGVGDEPEEVDVFFEQAVSTTARTRIHARRVRGRWSFMDQILSFARRARLEGADGASRIGARTYGARG
jgi:hypothetical protein